MTQIDQPFRFGDVAAEAAASERADFIRKTYLHLASAVGAFMVLEALVFLLVSDAAMRSMVGWMVGAWWSWLVVLGVFMGVSWLARSWAHSDTSPGVQYAGLGLYVLAQAAIFVPILFIASEFYSGVITTAALATALIFAGLTGFVFLTGKDFSFLRGILVVGGIAAMVAIVLAAVMGFSLGIIFTVLMIALASGYILYDTSNVLHHYRVGQHVAASLALFASVALLFWYVLRLVMWFQQE